VRHDLLAAARVWRPRCTASFRSLLDRAPLLIPGEDSAVRAPLLRWLRAANVHPRLVGEFDDGALMKAFWPGWGGSIRHAQRDRRRSGRAIRRGGGGREPRRLRERFFLITAGSGRMQPPRRRASVSEAARSGAIHRRGGRSAG